MKKHIKKLKSKLKGKPKESAIKNYKASYLDKRSKTYHRVVLTAFTGLFGIMGMIYVFGANASDGSANSTNDDNLAVVSIALIFIFIGLTTFIILLRKK